MRNFKKVYRVVREDSRSNSKGTLYVSEHYARERAISYVQKGYKVTVYAAEPVWCDVTSSMLPQNLQSTMVQRNAVVARGPFSRFVVGLVEESGSPRLKNQMMHDTGIVQLAGYGDRELHNWINRFKR